MLTKLAFYGEIITKSTYKLNIILQTRIKIITAKGVHFTRKKVVSLRVQPFKN